MWLELVLMRFKFVFDDCYVYLHSQRDHRLSRKTLADGNLMVNRLNFHKRSRTGIDENGPDPNNPDYPDNDFDPLVFRFDFDDSPVADPGEF